MQRDMTRAAKASPEAGCSHPQDPETPLEEYLRGARPGIGAPAPADAGVQDVGLQAVLQLPALGQEGQGGPLHDAHTGPAVLVRELNAEAVGTGVAHRQTQLVAKEHLDATDGVVPGRALAPDLLQQRPRLLRGDEAREHKTCILGAEPGAPVAEEPEPVPGRIQRSLLHRGVQDPCLRHLVVAGLVRRRRRLWPQAPGLRQDARADGELPPVRGGG
mmetsp:Transcript_50196/g.149894  ORF Transcript_50196/g.149894 Transcript_50196/m.149894 type:complete len:217 (-) Transcript_50196:19-669(-)